MAGGVTESGTNGTSRALFEHGTPRFIDEWGHHLSGHLQKLVAAFADERTLTHRNVVAALHALPAARTPAEEIIWLGLIVKTALDAVPGDGRAYRERRVDAMARVLLDSATARVNRRSLAERAAFIVQWSFASDVPVGGIANHLGCDETTLRRDFRAVYGMSLREYQLRVRVREALRLFVEGNINVLSVATLVGYKSEKNFYRAVRQVTGRTPGTLARLAHREIESIVGAIVPRAGRRA
jgi:AraC-like DNA-binding protein